jgi:hypothetical protein
MGVASSSSEAQAVIPLTEYGFIGYDSFLNPHAYFPDPILYPAPPEPGSTDMPYINDDDTTADYVPARPGICENWQSLYIKPPVGCERRSSQSLYFYTGA